MAEPMRPGTVVRIIKADKDDLCSADLGSEVHGLIARIRAAADAAWPRVISFDASISQRLDVCIRHRFERRLVSRKPRNARVLLPPTTIRRV
jgi:hypothetical protein